MSPDNDQDVGQLEQLPALRERVYDRLESLIVSGALKPGARLVEGQLATRLGVSRGPVREALQLLERDGWVELQARHGAFVHTPTEREVDDFYDLRRVLEIESARSAAARITPESAERLRAALERGRGMLDKGEHPLFEDYFERGRLTLHEEIVHVGGNVALIKMLTLLTKRNVWYSVPSMVTRSAAWDEHAAIVEAICSGDAELSMELMAKHVDHARTEFQTVLRTLPAASE